MASRLPTFAVQPAATSGSNDSLRSSAVSNDDYMHNIIIGVAVSQRGFFRRGYVFKEMTIWGVQYFFSKL